MIASRSAVCRVETGPDRWQAEAFSANPDRAIPPGGWVKAERRIHPASAFMEVGGYPAPNLLSAPLCLHGLRRAEACGLRFEDCDGEGVTIRRQVLEANGQTTIREATKTGKVRWVPIGPEPREELKGGSGYVLEGPKGKPMRPRNLARAWSSLVEETEFAGLTLHDLRSTMGMLMLEKGGDVRTAAEIMGHSPAMLAAIYARSRRDLKTAAVTSVYG